MVHILARIRAFLYEGIERFGMSSVVEGIPTLLHIAVFLFFAGLIEFLFPINHIIACTVLSIVSVCGFLYTTVTILPAIFRNCPYRTPLSTIYWQFTQTLHQLPFKIYMYVYTQLGVWRLVLPPRLSHGHSISMKEDVEIVATGDSQGCHERDLRALQWTMQCLTEDSELEPFVEGISALHSGASREKIRFRITKTVVDLLFDGKSQLLARTIRLLKTCEEPGALADGSRRKRVIICQHAITLLFRELNTSLSSYHDPIMLHGLLKAECVLLAHTLAKLQKDEVPAIASSANSLATTVLAYLHATVTVLNDIDRSLRSMIAIDVLKLLDILDAIDGVFGLLPTIALSLEPSALIRDHPVVTTLRGERLPHYLCCHPGALSSADQRNRVITFLQAVYVTAPHFPCNRYSFSVFHSTARCLVTLRNHDVQSIALYASCATARLAYHLQSDVVYWLEEQNYSDADHCFWALDTLEVLSNLDGAAMADLQRELMLGHGYSTLASPAFNTKWEKLRPRYRRTEIQPSAETLQLSPDSLEQFKQEFRLYTTGGDIKSDFALAEKVYLTQGHIIVLITLLQSIETSPGFLSDDVLQIALRTIQFITRGLTAQFSSHTAQSHLVNLIGKITKSLVRRDGSDLPNRVVGAELVSGVQVLHVEHDPQAVAASAAKTTSPASRDLVIKMIQALLKILGTIRDPDSIDDAKVTAKEVADDSVAPNLVRETAAYTLHQVRMPAHCADILFVNDFVSPAGYCETIPSSDSMKNRNHPGPY
jgi:Family of unknown function (DUF6535)